MHAQKLTSDQLSITRTTDRKLMKNKQKTIRLAQEIHKMIP